MTPPPYFLAAPPPWHLNNEQSLKSSKIIRTICDSYWIKKIVAFYGCFADNHYYIYMYNHLSVIYDWTCMVKSGGKQRPWSVVSDSDSWSLFCFHLINPQSANNKCIWKCHLLKSSAANNCQTLMTYLSIEANSVDQKQTAPIGTVWSRSTLFVIEAS